MDIMPGPPTLPQSCAKLQEEDIIDFKLIIKQLASIDETLKASVARISAVEEKVVASDAKLSKVEEDLSFLKDNYTELLSRIKFLEAENVERKRECSLLKVNNNTLMQRNRMQTVRIYNVNVEEATDRKAAKMLYEKFIRAAIIKEGDDDPGWPAVIEYAHLLPAHPDSKTKYSGFTYIVRFTTRFHKLRLILGKQSIIDQYFKKNKVKVKISQDLTWTNRQCLQRLNEMEDVAKVTLRGTRILYKKEEDESWTEVLNPYGLTLEEMDEI